MVYALQKVEHPWFRISVSYFHWRLKNAELKISSTKRRHPRLCNLPPRGECKYSQRIWTLFPAAKSQTSMRMLWSTTTADGLHSVPQCLVTKTNHGLHHSWKEMPPNSVKLFCIDLLIKSRTLTVHQCWRIQARKQWSHKEFFTYLCLYLRHPLLPLLPC